MGGITEVINVVITAQTASASVPTFNKPGIFGYHTAWPDLIRDYTDPTAFASDFASWPGMLAMGNAFFQQNPRPSTLAVGRFTAPTTKTFTVIPESQNFTTYSLQFNGNASLLASFTSDGASSVSEICAGLTTAINALSISGLTATNNTTNIGIAATSGTYFSMVSGQALGANAGILDFTETTANPGTLSSTMLGNIANVRNDWYAFDVQDHSAAIIEDVATWAEGNQPKFFVPTSADAGVRTNAGGNVAAALALASDKNCFLSFHPNTADYSGLRLVSFMFGNGSPDQITLSGQFQQSVDSAFPITANDVTNLKTNHVGVFRTVAGINMEFGSSDGIKTTTGQYIDVKTGVDWMTAALQQQVFNDEVNSAPVGGIPYTDKGFDQLENDVRTVQRAAVRNLLLADDANLTVSILPAAQQLPADRTARTVRQLKFGGRIAGKAENIFISGVLTT